jgi:hypothetical protein
MFPAILSLLGGCRRDKVKGETVMNDNMRPGRDDGSRAAATNNLTWAIAMVLVIAAIAIAVVFVAQNLAHLF